jgi:hypothetical protein
MPNIACLVTFSKQFVKDSHGDQTLVKYGIQLHDNETSKYSLDLSQRE